MTNSDIEDIDILTLEKYLLWVRKLTGISMGTNKSSLIKGRLRPRLRELGLSSYNQYLSYLDKHQDEAQEFINLITTNETSFFRTQRVWDYFVTEYLPQWAAANPKKTLKIWSGAASTGEEVYSIAICCEEFKQKNAGFLYQITGTDISSEVLGIAAKGEYAGRSIENFKNTNHQLYSKYMESHSDSFRVKSEVKSKINFEIQNLFQPRLNKNYYDIVFLRNVMIYFEPKDQEKVLLNVSKSMVENGVLIIGESESLNNLSTPFSYLKPLVYLKKGDS